ncbi:MAG TPA: ABC transporter permease [Dongiaceae bacterium]|nr:ABC transporter permease [Dongiaceae bacterium]
MEGHGVPIISVSGEVEGEILLSLSGRITLEHLETMNREFQSRLAGLPPAPLAVDLAEVDYLDSAGALALMMLGKGDGGRPIRFVNATPQAEQIIDLLGRLDLYSQHLKPVQHFSILEYAGEATFYIIRGFRHIMTFLGELLVAMIHAIRTPHSVRWADVLDQMKRIGVDGLPIVGLISMLVGVVMAFMSALQLKQFGADIYVASLVGIAIVKELGPMMTAIIVAGRSGSAFAAEIGTMMVDLEVDALVTMGFSPVRFLAFPKVLAAMLVVPLLTMYSFIFGIGGGMLVGVLGLDLTVFTYIQQTLKSITTFDIVTSLIKSMVFAVLIAGIGCQRGFQARGGAESVGSMTTSAVVSAIFLVIVADSAFAIVLHYLS